MKLDVMLNGVLLLSICSLISSLRKKAKPSRSLYPFLYFNEGDIPRMRRESNTTHRTIAARIVKVVNRIKQFPKANIPPSDWNEFSSKWNEIYGNNLCAMAMYCVLYEDDKEARNMVFRSMDILSALPNWRVKASLRDDVPVAHSLTGIATAYDFLYQYMTKEQRIQYMEKIVNVTEELYEKSFNVWWGKCYIQNHVATNYMALLTGSLVASRHARYSKLATKWKLRAHQMLARNIYILNYVVDGSMNEGVSYGSYTTRSLTQYLFFALRHLKMTFRKHIWLQEHFWFMYYTILPGFRETIGIGDSGVGWYYGPQSQLYFLDRYILKNGYANWLSSKIQESGFVNTMSGLASTVHTEFIFFDPRIAPKAPPYFTREHMHIFNDWGVAVYRNGMSTYPRLGVVSSVDEDAVYLSFKCGVLHGGAVNQMVTGRPPVPWIKSWRNFNPGHEHLDQGSFVFAPYGIPFITETYYGPKYTWLNNAILFGPSFASPCSKPLEGQIGECLKWFDYRSNIPWRARGKIVTSSSEEGLVLMCGEMASWYRGDLGLASVYRCLILLTPGVLLVVDHVERKRESTTNHMSAFFHNVKNEFHLEKCWDSHQYACAGMNIGNKTFRTIWVNSHGTRSTALVGKYDFSQFKNGKTNFVNITTPLHDKYTRVAYLFAGPGNDIKSLRISNTQDHGVHVSTVINRVRYAVAVVTKHALTTVRFDWLGFGGFAKVTIDKAGQRGSGVKAKTIRFVAGAANETKKAFMRRKRHLHEAPEHGHSILLLLVPTLSFLSLLFCYLKVVRKLTSRFYFKIVIVFLLIAYVLVAIVEFLHGCTSLDSCLWNLSPSKIVLNNRYQNAFLRAVNRQSPPFVVYTSLPWAGGEILGELFKNSDDFFHLEMKNQDFSKIFGVKNGTKARRVDSSNEPLDPCSMFQIHQQDQKSINISNWFRRYHRDPKSLNPSFPQRAQTSLPAVHLKDPGWGLRFHWLRRILGSRMKAVIVVRDPRSWVSTWLDELRLNPILLRNTKDFVMKLAKARCVNQDGNGYASELGAIQELFFSEHEGQRDVLGSKLLAHFWAAHTNAVLRMAKSVPKNYIRVIRLEDLVLRPKKTTQRVFQFLALPPSPSMENKFQQITRTGQFKFSTTHEHVGPGMLNSWKKSLKPNEIREIESICSLVMSQLRYKQK